MFDIYLLLNFSLVPSFDSLRTSGLQLSYAATTFTAALNVFASCC